MRETPTETRATPTLSTCFASAPSLRLSDRCMIPSGFTASSSSARQIVSTSGKSCACVNSPVGDIEATRYVRWNSNRASRHFWAGVRLRISPRAVQVHVLPTYVAGAGRSLRAESWPAASHSEGKRIGRIQGARRIIPSVFALLNQRTSRFLRRDRCGSGQRTASGRRKVRSQTRM
jgi:hypothetical protein